MKFPKKVERDPNVALRMEKFRKRTRLASEELRKRLREQSKGLTEKEMRDIVC